MIESIHYFSHKKHGKLISGLAFFRFKTQRLWFTSEFLSMCKVKKNCKKRCPFVAKQQYSTTLKWNEKRTMMYKSRSESWAWKIALHMCECFFCFGFSLQGARHTSRLIFRCRVVCIKDAALEVFQNGVLIQFT